MTTTAKLVAGAQSAFASLMTTELNTLGNGNAIIGSTAIDNSSNLDLEIELSFVSGGALGATGAAFIAVYLYPLNGDGSTYGDGRFGSAAAGPPPQSFFAGYAGLFATGSRTLAATLSRPDAQGTRIWLPRGSFKPVFHNGSGVALTASGNILYYRTTNIQFV